MTVTEATGSIGRVETARAAWNAIPQRLLDEIVYCAIDEDVGHGDITTLITIAPDQELKGIVRSREAGVIAGIEVAGLVFRHLDDSIAWSVQKGDGESVEPGAVVATVSGRASAVLSGERVALNLLQRMSGIATITSEYVARVEHTKARILDTRKTMPGLRLLDRFAVVCGGGKNHRFGLSDGILIKDNHIAVAGGIRKALESARSNRPHGMKIEIEVDTLFQVDEALAGGADIILLDNMSPHDLRGAVDLIAGRAQTEASGGVTLDTVQAIAETGVDYISVGRLTHSTDALDIGLDFQ